MADAADFESAATGSGQRPAAAEASVSRMSTVMDAGASAASRAAPSGADRQKATRKIRPAAKVMRKPESRMAAASHQRSEASAAETSIALGQKPEKGGRPATEKNSASAAVDSSGEDDQRPPIAPIAKPPARCPARPAMK